MDEYIVVKCRSGKGSYFYYKNGLLHREAGPAIVYPNESNNFGDDHLYKEQITLRDKPFGYEPHRINITTNNHNVTSYHQTFTKSFNAKYYVEGQPYTQDQFNAIKEKLDLKNELLNDLPSNQEHNKKNEI